MASSDLKFKNTALMLNASIFTKKEFGSLCRGSIGSNNVSTYKYTKSKSHMDKKSVHVNKIKKIVDKTKGRVSRFLFV